MTEGEGSFTFPGSLHLSFHTQLATHSKFRKPDATRSVQTNKAGPLIRGALTYTRPTRRLLPRSWLFAVLLWASDDLTHLLAHVMNVTGEESPAAQEWISLQAKVVEGMGGCTTATLRNPVKFSLDWTIWILGSEACRHGDRRNIMPTSTQNYIPLV